MSGGLHSQLGQFLATTEQQGHTKLLSGEGVGGD